MVFPTDVIALSLSAVISCGFLLAGARVMSRATTHYKEAQSVVRAIITTYGQRLQRQEEVCQIITNELGNVRALYEKLEKIQEERSHGTPGTISSTAALVAAMRDVSNNIGLLNQTLRINQTLLSGSSVFTESESPPLRLPFNLKGPEMTPTEFQALKILATEGNKTSIELHARIGRSREHFCRLMKRLYERGYVDRDTSKIPFVYRINQSVARNLLEESRD
jgi:hypothetical protein